MLPSLSACEERTRHDSESPAKELAGPVEIPDEIPAFPAIDPESITDLPILYKESSETEPYPQVPVRFGAPIHTGKWLGLANGDATFLGPHHLIINHFKRRPDWLGEGDLERSVIIDTRTGETRAEISHGRYAEFNFGLMIGYKLGDDRPYLVDPEAGTMVLAIPEGEHGYVWGKNWNVVLSHSSPRVWIVARSPEGTIHLQAWVDRTRPPPIPFSPFPWEPYTFIPHEPFTGQDADFVVPESPANHPDCSAAKLLWPLGWYCLTEESIEGDDPYNYASEGWWFSEEKGLFYNDRTGEGWSLVDVCEEDGRAVGGVLQHSPPRVVFVCRRPEDDTRSHLMVWSPPNKLQLAVGRDGENLASRPHYWLGENPGSFVVVAGRDDAVQPDPGRLLVYVERTGNFHFVAADYQDCDLARFGRGEVYLMECRSEARHRRRFDIVDTRRRRRGRFWANAAVANQAGEVFALVRRGGRDVVVSVSLIGV